MQVGGVSVNKGLREVVALGFVVTILTAEVVAIFFDPAIASRRPVFFAFIDATFGVFVIGAGYVVFGKRVIDAAIDTYKQLTGGESG